MNFTGFTKTFEGDRLKLRTMEEGDATELYAGWLNDPEVNRYLGTKSATLQELREYIAEKDSQNDALFFGIFLKDDERHIGTIKLEPIELEKNRTTIAIMIGDKEYWGKGYGREAMQLLMDWCFDALDCREMNLGVIGMNTGAIRAYEKLGFKEVERKIGSVRYGDAVHDHVLMAFKRPQ